MSARHHYTDENPEAWGGLGYETAPNPKCARPECEELARYDGCGYEEYCSSECVRAHISEGISTPLHLVTDEREQIIRDVAGRNDTDVQLLCSVLLDVTKDVKRLKKQVADLEGRVP